MTRLADLAELVRAPAALSVPGDVLSGAAAAGALGPRTPALAGASVLLYWAGMAANDWADRRLDAVDHVAARRAGVARGAQGDLDTGGGQLAADALQVGLTPAALRVAGVAPAQQQDALHGGGCRA